MLLLLPRVAEWMWASNPSLVALDPTAGGPKIAYVIQRIKNSDTLPAALTAVGRAHTQRPHARASPTVGLSGRAWPSMAWLA